jgi:hypothetical protein
LQRAASGRKFQHWLDSEGKNMMATPRDVLLIWVQAALEGGRSDPRPGSNGSPTRLLVKELEHLALALQANRGDQP